MQQKVGVRFKIGAKVYIYDNGFIHAKMMVVDENTVLTQEV